MSARRRRPPRARSIQGLGIVLLTLLGACSYIIEITWVDPEATPPTFELRKPASWFLGSSTPDIRELKVFAVSDDSTWNPPLVWRLVAEHNDGHPLPKVTYGQVPDGFEEVVSAEALVPGRTYRIEARAFGGSGQLDFEVDDSADGADSRPKSDDLDHPADVHATAALQPFAGLANRGQNVVLRRIGACG